MTDHIYFLFYKHLQQQYGNIQNFWQLSRRLFFVFEQLARAPADRVEESS